MTLIAALSFVALLPRALHAFPVHQGTEDVPEYRFDVRVKPDEHMLEGTLLVTLQPGDPRVGSEWRFHLPPNRFLAVDPRGRRRDTDSFPFERKVGEDPIDPMLPSGFESNGIEILSVSDPQGTLNAEKESNPRIPQGYFTGDAILRVTAADGRPLRAVMIRFRTHLPNRYVEGWSESGIFLEQWHPSLANHSTAGWDMDPESPRAGRFVGRITVADAGWLAVGAGLLARAAAGVGLDLPEGSAPARSLPVIFMPKAEALAFGSGDFQGYSLVLPGGERIARVSYYVAERFSKYMQTEYGLSLPSPVLPGGSSVAGPSSLPSVRGDLVLVQWDLPLGDMRTLGHMVLIPKVHRHDDPLLDRIYLANLAGAIARVWFGSTVWADEDKESWLPLGLSGLLALDFFESLYGPDGRVHTLTDWLNPRYRDNFIEAPVRNLIYSGGDAPLLISRTGYPYAEPAAVVTHYKSVLVLRMLSHVMGRDGFRRAVTTLYVDYAYRTADHANFERIASQSAGKPMDWFFTDWFAHAPRLDVQIASWSEVPDQSGHAVEVTVRRIGVERMPVDIEVTDAKGGKTTARYEGTDEQGTVRIPLPAEGVFIRLDPKEYLLEADRRNDQSSATVKLRPFYDWSKASDVLITVQGTIGGNAIDGNYAGLGIAVPISDTSSITAIPVYGERTGWVNYTISYSQTRFVFPRVSLGLNVSHLGGADTQSASLSYNFLTPDWLHVDTSFTTSFERVDAETKQSGDTTVVQNAAQANNVSGSINFNFLWSEALRSGAGASIEHSDPGLDSAFTYTTYSGSASQTFRFDPRNQVSFGVSRIGTDGTPPIQREVLIGGPGALRGYPRTLNLVYEQMELVRIDYAAVLARGIWGSTVQLRQVNAFLFADVGKGWDNQQSEADVPQRQDVGIGFEVRLSAIGVVEFPLRVDVAFPVNDKQYTSPQFILFEALAF